VLPAPYKIFRPDSVQKIAAPGEESWVHVMKFQKCENVNILVFYTSIYSYTKSESIEETTSKIDFLGANAAKT
jgi:hypothetical protein